VAEGARLESVYTATYRGFESPSHRHNFEEESERMFRLFFCLFSGNDTKKPGLSRVLSTVLILNG
jgi:hypothetical protein